MCGLAHNNSGNCYGLLPPAGLQDRFVGLTYFENTTMSFTATIFKDPPLPASPRAYGFNTLLLSNTSSAKLDAPSPRYVRQVQASLIADETYNLTADVLATVTSYNDSVERLRDDDQFWKEILSQPDARRSPRIPQSTHSLRQWFKELVSGVETEQPRPI